MAWRRGTQNQQAGAIRKGHVKEFLVPSSKKLATEDEQCALKVVDAPTQSACAYARYRDLPPAFRAAVDAHGCVHVHFHEHPAHVQRLVIDDSVPEGCISLNDVQRLNNRVCVHDAPSMTLYRGRHEALDAREAAIGATDVVVKPDSELAAVVFEVRRRDASKDVAIDAVKLSALLGKHCFGCVVTVPEVHVLTIDDVVVVARVVEVRADRDEEEDDEDDDEYRGVVTASTAAYVITDGAAPPGTRIKLENIVQIPPKNEQADCVDVICDDDEVFPVKRALLRPCLALTKAAQAGRGKYTSAEEIRVPLDCCTFDRVLLYLQHARRGAPFRFDPTLAPELLEAALALKIRGLEEDCRKVLGSFEERVRKSPIRLAEVRQRNAKGSLSTPRGETWLLLDGMVLDISRWLSEHPGGDSIIPQQALNCDSTVMFELYHVSRQSFLYLREFYVGELHPDDLADVPLPNKLPPGGDGGASPAFLAELRRHTRWRLKKEELVFPAWKSF